MTSTLELPDGRLVPLTDGLVIGRVKPAGLVLNDGKVSRQHARVIVEAGVVEVEDLGSRNGTRINGQTISRKLLRDGDVLECGGTEMTFHDGQAASVEPAAPADEILFDDDPAPAVRQPVPARAPERPPERSAPKPAAQMPSIDPSEDLDEISFDEPVSRPRVHDKPAPESPAASSPGLVEFEDEVVEVRSAPSPRTKPVPSLASRPAATDRGSAGSLMTQDLDQLGGTRRLLINLLAILVALAVGYGAYLLAV